MHGSAPREVPVRDLAAKLRITAAVLGCASQKDLCARFHQVNPGTMFDLERSYKWMQGRALPRSAQVYEDWAALLGTDRPISHLQSCTVDEFLDLVCGLHELSRDALIARAGIAPGVQSEAIDLGSTEPPGSGYLTGAYACYSHAWSPYFQGKIIRGSLLIEAVVDDERSLAATYSQTTAFGRVQFRGPVTIVNRSVHIELLHPTARSRLTMCLFQPAMLASVLGGVMSGTTFVHTPPQPAASRILIIRAPGAEAGVLEKSNRYFDPAETPISSDLLAFGMPVAAPAELDALLEEFLAADSSSGYIKVTSGEYSKLTLAIDRLLIDSGTLLIER